MVGDGPDFKKALESLGIKTEAFEKIRLGRGVVGKTSHVAIAVLMVLGVIAYNLRTEWMLLTLAAIVMVGAGLYHWATLRFAERNPDQALLEGAEIVAYKQMELAAKGQPNPSPTPVIVDPEGPPIVAIPQTAEPDK